MVIVALKYPLPGTEKIFKEEFQICLPSLCEFNWLILEQYPVYVSTY